jgi:hypothetical protein
VLSALGLSSTNLSNRRWDWAVPNGEELGEWEVIIRGSNWKITMLLMGKSTISMGPFSIAILVLI